jgi:hypothetical protein
MEGKEHGEDFADQGQERRVHPRYSVDADSVLMLVSHGLAMKARIIELSAEGCRVRTDDRFTGKTGRPVEVAFKVKGFAFRFSGVVRWSDGQHMVGIHFENMIPRRKAELVEVIEEIASPVAPRTEAVKQLVAAQGTQAPAPPVIPKAVKAEPIPIRPRVAEAIKPPVPAHRTVAPVETRVAKTPAKAEPPVKIEPSANRPAKGRDRRAQSRAEVDTSATIFLVNVGSALRGRIIDLSPGGCRIRTDERFPVGIYTRVETEFQLQGLPFRLGGVIQAIHNRFMVGIRFLDLSERKREQVLDLIREIDEMRAETPSGEGSSTP